MAVFVLTAIALLAAALGMVVVAAVVLGRQMRSLTGALKEAGDRVSGLVTELQEESAVTSIEVGVLQDHLSDLRVPARQRTNGSR